jgi:hypothetical protein
MKTFKKLSLRLMILAAMIGGIFLLHKDNVSANAIGCEFPFQACMDNCQQGNGACYADCHVAYMRCLEEPIID